MLGLCTSPGFSEPGPLSPSASPTFRSFSCARALIGIHYGKESAVTIQPRQKVLNPRSICLLLCFDLPAALKCTRARAPFFFSSTEPGVVLTVQQPPLPPLHSLSLSLSPDPRFPLRRWIHSADDRVLQRGRTGDGEQRGRGGRLGQRHK